MGPLYCTKYSDVSHSQGIQRFGLPKMIYTKGKILADMVSSPSHFPSPCHPTIFPSLPLSFFLISLFLLLESTIAMQTLEILFLTCIHAFKGGNVKSANLQIHPFPLSVIRHNSVPVGFQRWKEKNKYFIASKFSFVTFLEKKHSIPKCFILC